MFNNKQHQIHKLDQLITQVIRILNRDQPRQDDDKLIIYNLLSQTEQLKGYEELVEPELQLHQYEAGQVIATGDVHILLVGQLQYGVIEISRLQISQTPFQCVTDSIVASFPDSIYQVIHLALVQKTMDKKMQFFSQYPFFQTLSLRQLRNQIDQFQEYTYLYGANLSRLHRHQICLIKHGYTVESIQQCIIAVQLKEEYSKDVYALIHQGDLFGECHYLQATRVYDAICHSQTVTIYPINYDQIESTQHLKHFLQAKLTCRLNRMKKMIPKPELEIEVIPSRNKFCIIDKLESDCKDKSHEAKYKSLIKSEQNSFLQFQDLLQKMNNSIIRTKKYFQQRQIPKDILFCKAFMSQKHKEQPSDFRKLTNSKYQRPTTSNTRHTKDTSELKILIDTTSVSFCRSSKMFNRATRSKSLAID